MHSKFDFTSTPFCYFIPIRSCCNVLELWSLEYSITRSYCSRNIAPKYFFDLKKSKISVYLLSNFPANWQNGKVSLITVYHLIIIYVFLLYGNNRNNREQ